MHLLIQNLKFFYIRSSIGQKCILTSCVVSQMKSYRVKFLNPEHRSDPKGGWEKERKAAPLRCVKAWFAKVLNMPNLHI